PRLGVPPRCPRRYHAQCGQPDALILLGDVLWIVDFKTCEESPKVRLETCPFEFQTRHYLAIASKIFGAIKAKYKLADKVTFGGMIHVCIQKPTIDFG